MRRRAGQLVGAYMAAAEEKSSTVEAKGESAFAAFCEKFKPLEPAKTILQLVDQRTGAHYCECHIKASKLVKLATTDAPLDLDEPEYRANRELVLNAPAFAVMKADALARRSFSNTVAEYSTNPILNIH